MGSWRGNELPLQHISRPGWASRERCQLVEREYFGEAPVLAS